MQVLLTDDELDLSMREADVAIRLRQPVQGDLIQRRLFTVHFHAYASADYIKGHGQPKDISELEEHRILTYGGVTPSYLLDVHWLTTVGRDPKNPRQAALTVNNITALKRAVERGIGIAVLPDYLVEADSGLVQVLNSRRDAIAGQLPRLSRGDEERRARAGFPRLPRQQGPALDLLTSEQP